MYLLRSKPFVLTLVFVSTLISPVTASSNDDAAVQALRQLLQAKLRLTTDKTSAFEQFQFEVQFPRKKGAPFRMRVGRDGDKAALLVVSPGGRVSSYLNHTFWCFPNRHRAGGLVLLDQTAFSLTFPGEKGEQGERKVSFGFRGAGIPSLVVVDFEPIVRWILSTSESITFNAEAQRIEATSEAGTTVVAIVLNPEKGATRFGILSFEVSTKSGGTIRIGSFCCGKKGVRKVVGVKRQAIENLKVPILVKEHSLANLLKYFGLTTDDIDSNAARIATAKHLSDLFYENQQQRSIGALEELAASITTWESEGQQLLSVRIGPNWKGRDEDLVHLQRLKHLRLLDLSYSPVTDAALLHVAGLSSLEGLGLHFTRCGDAGLAHLKGLRRLKLLNLRGTRLSDSGLSALTELKNLELLNLGMTTVTDAGVKRIQSLPKLKVLELDDTRITDRSLKMIGAMKNLRILNLSRTQISSSGIGDLNRLQHLEGLDIRRTNVSDTGLLPLGQMSQLKTLHLGELPNVSQAGRNRLQVANRTLEIK